MELLKLSRISFISYRRFSISSKLCGKRNFRKFVLPNRGSNIFKERQKTNPDPKLTAYKSGVREVGYQLDDKYVVIPERVPEIIIPDLTNFQLKPYVSYRVPDVVQSEFTPEDLFEAIYIPKMRKDFEDGKLDLEGNSLEPNEMEKMTSEEAWVKARQTGSDIFEERSKREEEEKYL